ncbi:hypothetical protein RB653_009882 [Dictyostelium firmibasis]|uniref:EGF-like domain-containing protein n=1 Tax=Dictyostelium firmibasis TaxID=79012 RepID=A0AAN7TJZ0_9MYCE
MKSRFNLSVFNGIANSSLCTSSFTCNETTGSIIGTLTLTADEHQYPVNTILFPNDLLAFTNVESFNIQYFEIDSQFIYYKFPKLTSISLAYVKGLKEINQTLPSYSYLFIYSKDLDNTTFKMSYISVQTSYFTIGSGYVNLINDFPSLPRLVTLNLAIRNLPNMSNFQIMTTTFYLSDDFQINSFTLNYKTLKKIPNLFLNMNSTNDVYFPIEPIKDQAIFPNLFYSLNFNMKFYAPIDNKPLNLSNHNINSLRMDDAGKYFNIEKSNSIFGFPILLDTSSKIIFSNGNITQTKPISQFGNSYYIEVTKSNIGGDLDIYQPTDGKPFRIFDFSNNSITGTIDESWCNTLLFVRYNRMSGTIPSCFSCYFNYPISSGVYNLFYEGFLDNYFSNLDVNTPCTTFQPHIEFSSNSSLLIYGNDIGFFSDNYLINGSLGCRGYIAIEFGKKYECIIFGHSFFNVNYITFNFKYPNDRDYYFSLIKRSPIISSVIVTSNGDLLVNGSYFSSYLGHVPQSISIGNYLYDIKNSSDFFSINAEPLSTVVSSNLTVFDLLTLNTNSTITRVLINSSEINNRLCKNDCIDNDHGICNLYTGICVCNNDWIGDDCSISNIFISSVQPSTTNGGEASFVGFFLNDFSSVSITIGALDCRITFNSTNLIKCIAPPGNGIKTVILKQNNKFFKGNNIYKYIEIVLPCPNKCSNNGICNTTTGICNCNNGYSLYDCSAQINTDTGGSGTNTTIDPNTGSTNITNSQTQFQVYIKSLIEVDLNNNIIKSYSLLSDWTFNKTVNEIEPNKYILKQQLKNNNSSLNSNGCIVTSIIEEIKDKNGKEFTFAGTSFIVSSGSIKFTISIANYTYQNNLNTLKLELISSVVDNIDKINNDCNSKDTEIDTSNVNDLSTFNYIKISKNNKIFSGRFINKVISDGRPTFFTTNSRNNSNSIIVTLNLPHCVNECLIDPDFSVLISNDFKSECNDDDSSRKWLIPVAVVVPVVGVAIIITIFFAIYKKKYCKGGEEQIDNFKELYNNQRFTVEYDDFTDWILSYLKSTNQYELKKGEKLPFQLKKQYTMDVKINNGGDIFLFRIWRNIVLKNIILQQLFYLNKNFEIRINKKEQLLNSKYRDYIKELYYFSNENIYLGDIPSSVESLTFGDYFNQVLSEGSIPSSVKSLTFGYCFNQVLSEGLIPSSVKSLTFGHSFNQVLSAGSIPSSVKSLTFGYCFNQELSAESIPSSVKSLTFGNDFNQVLSARSIPSSVKSLTFGDGFNQVLSEGSIPSSVKSLTFGNNFNRILSAGSIPSSVKSLTFGRCFNQALSEGLIPSSVKSLTFGHSFNQVLSAGSIPSNVESLTFGYCFDRVLSEGSIPSSAKSLTFGYDFNQVLSAGSIPSSVESLTFGTSFNKVLSAGSIPSSVKSLTFGYYFNQVLSEGLIPSSVKSLTFGNRFDQVLSEGSIPSSVKSLTFGNRFDQVLSAGSIPSSVKSLTFGDCFNQELSEGSIPSSVESLTFGHCFNQELSAGSIPSSVKSLTLGDFFIQELSEGSIPSNVKSLTFGCNFSQVLSSGSIPSSVTSLAFGNCFNQVLSEGLIPSSVKSLTFGYCFNQVLSAGSIPSNVKSLIFGDCFNQVLSEGSIPSSVKSLSFGSDYNQVLSAGSIPTSVKSVNIKWE